MGEMTTIGEILEFAIAREAEAVHFYLQMAQRASDPATVEFFEDLIAEELEHKSRLELEIMKEGMTARTVGVVPEVAGGRLQVSSAEVAEKMNYRQALSLAVRKERRSFRLYVRLAGLVSDETLRETLVSLAEEEARHTITLEEKYNNAMTEQQ